MGAHGTYYIPQPSHWPLLGSIGLTTTFIGAGAWLHHNWYGPYIFFCRVLYHYCDAVWLVWASGL